MRLAMGYRLKDRETFTIIAGRAIFLDLACDRYFCLSADVSQILLAVLEGRSTDVAPEIESRAILATGLFVPIAGDELPRPCDAGAPPRLDLHDLRPLPRRSLDLAVALVVTAATRFELRYRSLFSVVDRLRRLKETSRPREPVGDVGRATGIASGFAWSQALLSSHRRCLPRSIALTSRLLRSGFEVELVLGVRLDPFGAHAWVRSGELVLNDDAEAVSRYSPILVV
jgi:hypothetical protein